jgi:hypothetical protein
MPKTVSTAESIATSRPLVFDLLAGLTVVLWGAGVLAMVAMWEWDTRIIASAILLAAATITIVTVIVGCSDADRRAARVEHRERIEALATIAGQVEQLSAKVGDGRWMGWAERLAAESFDGGDVVPFPARQGR